MPQTLNLFDEKWLVLLAGLAAFGLGILPAVHHLIFGLRERRREILSYFDDSSILLYFKQFYFAEWEPLSKGPAENIRKALEKMYNERFGARTFLKPIVLYMFSLAIVVVAIVQCVLFGNIKWAGATFEIRGLYALAGAYLWVILDIISRYRQRDLVPSSLYGYTFRFITAIPLAYALSTLFNDAAAPPLAFALGAFPTNTLMLILRRQGAQKLGLGNDTEKQTLELEKLQGLNTTLAERFSEIGIMTTLQLAYEDPIQLTMRTNLSFNLITDVISQALATIYGLDLAATRPYSVRGAIEAAELFEDSINKRKPDKRARADVVIAKLAEKLQLPELIIQKILSDIREDPYTDFLRDIWA